MRWTLPVWARHARDNPAHHLHRVVSALQDPAPPVRLLARLHLRRKKTALGFRTGDLVMVRSGKGQGVHKGRIPIRMTGNFNIQSGRAGAATL
jgi:hypothetical protein